VNVDGIDPIFDNGSGFVFDECLMSEPTKKRYEDETTDYRRGFVEGLAGERDVYLLLTGCVDVAEYNRGFKDGQAEQREI
jgi:hypothetical protein